MEGRSHTKKFQITDETVKQFAEASRDWNPIHLDEEYAKGTIFKRRVCHGMLIAGLFSAVIGNEFPGQGTIYVTQTLKFRRPVFVGDEVTIVVKVLEILEKKRVKLETVCMNNEDEVAVTGEAVVIPPDDFV